MEKSIEEQRERELLTKASVLLKYSWVICDVVDGYLMKTDGYLKELEIDAIYGKKRRLRAIRNQIGPIRESLKKILSVPYDSGFESEQAVGDFCDDSDFLSDFLLLLLDRCGEGKKAQIHIRSMLRKEPSKSGLYELLNKEKLEYEKMVRERKKDARESGNNGDTDN